ncbi:MAG: dienelactone hydrolase family protein [Actinomycetota bacterium]|nr:dienelactone hydrolase family protein [Actinomycetota bacterium]
MKAKRATEGLEKLVKIPIETAFYPGSDFLEGILALPQKTKGIVLFAHGSGSSRLSPRNNFVAGLLREAGIGTLLFDLLTEEEDLEYSNRFDIDLLTERLLLATKWVENQPETRGLQIGYFGASTGAAAALQAAVEIPSIFAIVSRGGRPDLVMSYLPKVKPPTLLIVGEYDEVVIELNQRAYEELKTGKELAIVPRATHLFEEPGALEEVARLATDWFLRHLKAKAAVR